MRHLLIICNGIMIGEGMEIRCNRLWGIKNMPLRVTVSLVHL